MHFHKVFVIYTHVCNRRRELENYLTGKNDKVNVRKLSSTFDRKIGFRKKIIRKESAISVPKTIHKQRLDSMDLNPSESYDKS